MDNALACLFLVCTVDVDGVGNYVFAGIFLGVLKGKLGNSLRGRWDIGSGNFALNKSVYPVGTAFRTSIEPTIGVSILRGACHHANESIDYCTLSIEILPALTKVANFRNNGQVDWP